MKVAVRRVTVHWRGLTAAVALVALFAAQARAADTCPATAEPSTWTARDARTAKDCISTLADAFDIRSCESPMCKRVDKWRELEPRARVEQSSTVISEVRASLESSVLPSFSEAEALRNELTAWLHQLRLLKPEDLRDETSGALGKGFVGKWKYDRGAHVLLPGSLGETRIGEILERECAASETRCTRAVRGSGAVVVYGRLAQVVASQLLNEARNEAVDYVEMLDRRWATYFDKSRAQYPWELLVNSWRFKPQAGEGLASPPSDQLILFHPNLGFRYGDNAERSFDQALVLEVAGYYRWRWDGSEAKGLLGGSLIAVWVNEPTVKKVGWGLMVHLPKQTAIGVYTHDGPSGRTTSLVFSLNVAKVLQNAEEQKKTLLGM